MPDKIGFIGMGIMGQAMAQNVRRAGYELMVYNRTLEKTGTLAQAGALVAKNPKEIGQWTQRVVLMLTGPKAIDAILHGDDGLLAGMPAESTIINMSTVSPAYTRKLADTLRAHGITLIDAPVSGSKKPAQEASLVILAGGPLEKIKELEPLLLSMGKKVVSCGEAGQGSSMKMTVNLLLGIMMAGLSEAITFGQKCGLQTETVLDTILAGPLGCGLYALKAEMFRSDLFQAQFPLKHMAKDMGFVLETAAGKGVAVPGGRSAAALYQEGLQHGLADLDFAAVKKVLEGMEE